MQHTAVKCKFEGIHFKKWPLMKLWEILACNRPLWWEHLITVQRAKSADILAITAMQTEQGAARLIRP